MRLPIVLLGVFLLPVALVAQEQKDKPKTIQPIKVITLTRKEAVQYEKDIEPVVTAKCAFCHSGNVKEGKLDLASYDSMMKGGKRGAAVAPGKSTESASVPLAGTAECPTTSTQRKEAQTADEGGFRQLVG